MNLDTSTPAPVTGAKGSVASWIVERLPDERATVHGTARELANPATPKHPLGPDDDAPGTLKPFGADLAMPGAFGEAIPDGDLVKQGG